MIGKSLKKDFCHISITISRCISNYCWVWLLWIFSPNLVWSGGSNDVFISKLYPEIISFIFTITYYSTLTSHDLICLLTTLGSCCLFTHCKHQYAHWHLDCQPFFIFGLRDYAELAQLQFIWHLFAPVEEPKSLYFFGFYENCMRNDDRL